MQYQWATLGQNITVLHCGMPCLACCRNSTRFLASLLSQTARLTLSAAGAAAGDVVIATRTAIIITPRL